MLINYWTCKHSAPEHENVSDIDNPDYEWKYYCDHPDNNDKYCYLDNKWDDDKDDCEYLGNTIKPDKQETKYGR